MRFRELGDTGEKLPCLGMGSWKFGYNAEEEVAAIREGICLGMNFIDTAEMYHSEDTVGKAINGEDVFVATKVSPNHFNYHGVIKACESSLKNLGIKSIDLYQLHWPNPAIPITETMDAMEHLVKEGKIRHIGVSNFSIEELKEARAALKSEDIVSNQIEYSPFVREIADYLMPYCKKEKITIIAYSPLGSGAMARLQSTNLFATLARIGGKYKKSPFQVALSWLMSKDNVIPIPKAATVLHVRENADSINLKLSRQDILEIDGTTDSNIKPLASKLTWFAKSNTGFFSGVMEKREKLRKHGI